MYIHIYMLCTCEHMYVLTYSCISQLWSAGDSILLQKIYIVLCYVNVFKNPVA